MAYFRCGGGGHSDAEYNNLMDQLIEETATGPIASFTDGANNIPAKEVISHINPTETGTGEKSPQNPYVIGGFTECTVTRSQNPVNSNRLIVISHVQDGSGDPSPENIRPISAGLTIVRDDDTTLDVYDGTLDAVSGELKIKQKAVVFNENSPIRVYYQLYIKSDATACYQADTDIYPLNSAGYKPGGLSDKTKGSSSQVWANTGYVNRNAINYQNVYINIDNALLGITDYTQETPASALEKYKAWLANNPITVLVPVDLTIQLSATELERAKAALGITTYTVPFGQTVYGGELILQEGQNDKINKVLSNVDMGTLSWKITGTRFYASIRGIKQSIRQTKVICSIYETKENGETYDPSWNNVIYVGGDSVYVHDSRFDNVADFKAAMSGIILYYELATPEEITLPTKTVIPTLLGANNFYHDCNGDIDVTYRANGALYVQEHPITRGLMAARPTEQIQEQEEQQEEKEINKSEDN